MADQPAPLRRFQFSLWSLLIVVTLLAGVCGCVAWVAREVAIVHERRQLFYYAAPRPTPSATVIRSLTSDDPPSFLRRLLGDHTFSQIVLDDSATDEELLRYETAYPEADVVRFTESKATIRGPHSRSPTKR